ncbi:unnamed protein product [Ambrosiozyma monospora]|uniref:Unnamed protein product n=1 Tax=Ambrosiozyma monospora TaxID=43982 RepID=A0A9W6YLI7_AMBMO|nr:unnamed protein product [Ambrosiozyma monospora]
MAFSNPNLNETGIKLASCLLPEIQLIIMKFIIEDFLYFIDDANGVYQIRQMYHNHYAGLLSTNHTTIKCSNIFQAQLLSITGYDDLLDHIVCMALEELDLTLVLEGVVAAPLIDEFMSFVTARSVQLKRLEMVSFNSKSVNEFTSPHRTNLLELHSGEVSLSYSPEILASFAPLNFVTCLSCKTSHLSELLASYMLNEFTSLTKFCVGLPNMSELPGLEGIMERLQLAVPSMKQLYLQCIDDESAGQLVVDSLVQANTFIRKHKNLNIQFAILFQRAPDIQTYWIFDSKTQFSLPLHTECPMDIRLEVDKLDQWCSISGIACLILRPYALGAIPFFTNTKMTPFVRAVSSTVELLVLNNLSAEYEIVLDGFRTLKELFIRHSILNKFPKLPESLRELSIQYVNDLTMSDMENGIILPTQLFSLTWQGNLSCFTLPKILNIDKLLHLKDVSVEIEPFQFIDICGEEGYDLKDSVTRKFLRLTNTCTVDQLQKFVSQLPSELEILNIYIYGYVRPNLDNYSACCPVNLPLKHFTNLYCHEFICFNNGNPFDVSVFPDVEHLCFFSPPVLTGCFAKGIRSLDVSLDAYGESVSYFLNHFISKLTSLVRLSIDIDKNTSADIREVALPSHLCFFRIVFNREYWWRLDDKDHPDSHENKKGCVILDTVPVQLNHLELKSHGGAQPDIIVDDCKGETISSMAKRIRVSWGEPHWIQLCSHIDCDMQGIIWT